MKSNKKNMPKAKPTKIVEKKDSEKELLDIVSQGFREMTDNINNINLRIDEIESRNGQSTTVDTGLSGESTLKEKPDKPKTYTNPAYKEAAEKILGPDFGFEVEMVGDQEMAVVTVPDKYRNKGVLDAYLSHWKSRRIVYENELTRINPNISLTEKDAKLREYDERNPDPVIPKDQRHKAMSTIKTIVDLRKWLLLVKENIKQELKTVKREDIMPKESLQEELEK
jgi:hypothetical protein